MKHQDTEDRQLTILSIAGYCTEQTLWNLVHDMALRIKDMPVKVDVQNVIIDGSEFKINSVASSKSEDAVWHLGRTLYHLATGLPPFGGAELSDLHEDTPIPVIPHTQFSEALCDLVRQCMELNPTARPTIDHITVTSKEQIQKLMKRKTDHSSLRIRMQQKASLLNDKVHFWKEAMTIFILSFLLSIPALTFAQNNPEMEKIVRLTQSMRKQSNRQKVLSELMKDNQWTMMDELKVHVAECSYKDKVSMFGMNDIAREIARKEKGIVNHGNRFKHSADEKHPYSFVELTVQKGGEVCYLVGKHVGRQDIIIVPFDAKQAFSAKGTGVKRVFAQSNADGTMRMTLTPDSKGNYTFSIKNEGKKNASFVVITYNSKK